MVQTEIARHLEDFIAEALRDDSGMVPEATLELEWPAGSQGFLIGDIPEGASEPEGGVRTRVVDVRLTFGSLVPKRKAAEAIIRLATRLAEDPALEERLESRIEIRDPEVAGNDGGDWVGTVTISLSSVE